MVLRRRPDHRWTADIDLLNHIGTLDLPRHDGRLEGVQVAHDDIYPPDPVRLCFSTVNLSTSENASVDLGVQRFHATIHDFWMACVVADLPDIEPRANQRLRCSSSREEGVSKPTEALCQFNNAGLVGYRKKRNRCHLKLLKRAPD